MSFIHSFRLPYTRFPEALANRPSGFKNKINNNKEKLTTSFKPEDHNPSVNASIMPIKKAPAIAAGAFVKPPTTAATNALIPSIIPMSYVAPEIGAITVPAKAPIPALTTTASSDILFGLIPIKRAANGLTTQAVNDFPVNV